MKKIEAIIRPGKLDEVKNSLADLGVNGITVSHVIGCGKQKGHLEVYRGVELTITLLPKVKIEMVVKDGQVETVLNAIQSVCRSGKIGDGKIFVYPIENAVRIRTGETGEEVL
ncbi:MAG: P-II family nitrogen regulator [Desulfitobacteriaceae bacterium]